MSVYIKGMEMPTGCIDCPFMVSRDNDDCILQSAEANENFENWEQMKANCPLVSVPEHGDLIDRSELKNKEIAMDYDERDDIFEDVFLFVTDLIDAAPTIIPADKEG